MPQLDTSTWSITIITTIITLFIFFQMKISSFNFPPKPQSKNLKTHTIKNPWENKWTKIYSPPSLPLQ
uniref:ATP synthase complex subunit 8 n=1 Tax=Anomalurus beecrofti TaxID=1082180 RepID=A0A343EVM4_9RODE|nr:ATP synthase F0 subunit 8 [Anomalurus beecrofti]ASM91410.1 ATP synthase subunit 8 [Anomalurus beecrofti]